jgi:hypothetical protein
VSATTRNPKVQRKAGQSAQSRSADVSSGHKATSEVAKQTTRWEGRRENENPQRAGGETNSMQCPCKGMSGSDSQATRTGAAEHSERPEVNRPSRRALSRWPQSDRCSSVRSAAWQWRAECLHSDACCLLGRGLCRSGLFCRRVEPEGRTGRRHAT